MTPYFSRIFICLSMSLLLSYSGAAQAQTKAPSSGFLSLSEAIQQALTHNPLKTAIGIGKLKSYEMYVMGNVAMVCLLIWIFHFYRRRVRRAQLIAKSR